ncbi:hypothetical protein [Tropicimonas marinistellae]|nr:hypothetical protein [Tropicimonas marinistellae]
MPHKRRWIASVIAAAEALDAHLPWERGARREEWIARRNGARALPQALSA